VQRFFLHFSLIGKTKLKLIRLKPTLQNHETLNLCSSVALQILCVVFQETVN